jgi:hypothetical protein
MWEINVGTRALAVNAIKRRGGLIVREPDLSRRPVRPRYSFQQGPKRFANGLI